MTKIAFVIVALGLVSSCKIKNELSCELPENATMPACLGNSDAPTSCTESTDCTDNATPFCQLPAGTCVACLLNDDCGGATPVCGATGSCQACVAHGECGSEVCLPTGACAEPDQVAYIEAGPSGDCSQASPCDDPLEAFTSTTKSIFKITGPIVVDQTQVVARSVVMFADPMARISRSNSGPIFTVANGFEVTIYDLEIAGALAGGDGIAMSGSNTQLTLERVILNGNDGHGVLANNTSSTGKLTMRRSIVVANDGGGVNASGVKIDMTNNLFVNNGSGGVNSGGLILDPLGGSIFEFNTIANNVSSSALTDGISCVGSFPASNNIVVDNTLGAQCSFTFTMYDNNTVMPTPAEGNFEGDPRFENENPGEFRDPLFYRIKSDSDAIDKATTSTIDIDIDGQDRALAPDVGADERMP